MTDRPYNPLDRINLGKSVAEALLDKEPDSLGKIISFQGAGIYTIYYRGEFEPYSALARRNSNSQDWPIYIGKAIPAGGRVGIKSKKPSKTPLFDRLDEHAETIRLAENLNVEDFLCRYLTIEDIWIPLAETLLITSFKPLWNVELAGFGNHDPGKGRYDGMRPLWDVLHPGRAWALKCQERNETPAELSDMAREFLKTTEPPLDPRLKFTADGGFEDGLA